MDSSLAQFAGQAELWEMSQQEMEVAAEEYAAHQAKLETLHLGVARREVS